MIMVSSKNWLPLIFGPNFFHEASPSQICREMMEKAESERQEIFMLWLAFSNFFCFYLIFSTCLAKSSHFKVKNYFKSLSHQEFKRCFSPLLMGYLSIFQGADEYFWYAGCFLAHLSTATHIRARIYQSCYVLYHLILIVRRGLEPYLRDDIY